MAEEEKKEAVTPSNRQKQLPTVNNQITQNTGSPARGYSAKTFDQSLGYLKSNPSTASNQDKYRSSSELRQAAATVNRNSDVKPPMTVVYDEYKYIQRPFDPNGDDYQKMNIQMIQLSKKPPYIEKSHKGHINKKEDRERNMKIIQYSPVSAIPGQGDGYQLSENEHQIFNSFSPCKIMSTGEIQAISGGENRHYRASSEVNLADIYDKKINDLKNHIKHLEKQLR